MHMEDGRVVSNFILQALQNLDITIYGGGKQTRSFQYVDDLVDGLIGLMNSGQSSKNAVNNSSLDITSPVNIGNPDEHTIEEFATIIKEMVGTSSKIVHHPATEDDPQRRKPDIEKAFKGFGWKPVMPLKEGKFNMICEL